jgi:hypothetical protein
MSQRAMVLYAAYDEELVASLPRFLEDLFRGLPASHLDPGLG